MKNMSIKKIETNENDILKLATKMIHSEKKMLECETKLEQVQDALSNTVSEGKFIKNMIQLLYDRGLFENFPIKDQVFESYLSFNEDYLLKKYGKEIVLDGNIYYLSPLEQETPRENIIQGINNNETIDMVDLKHRMELTKIEISRIINERKTIPRN